MTADTSDPPRADMAPTDAGRAARTITIVFTADGAADCEIVPGNGVTPGQLYSAAWLLDAYATAVRGGQVMAEAKRRQAIAGMGVPDIGHLLAQLRQTAQD